MKLKNLFICIVIGLFFCIFCIKDEVFNVEVDILNCIFFVEMLIGIDIDYNCFYDKSLNVYFIYIEVNNGIDLIWLVFIFELIEGVFIELVNGSI